MSSCAAICQITFRLSPLDPTIDIHRNLTVEFHHWIPPLDSTLNPPTESRPSILNPKKMKIQPKNFSQNKSGLQVPKLQIMMRIPVNLKKLNVIWIKNTFWFTSTVGLPNYFQPWHSSYILWHSSFRPY